jgi:hypothetical protein
MSVIESTSLGGVLPGLRHWARTILWHLREISLVATPIFLLFRFVGGFSTRQSIFVALLAHLLYLRFRVYDRWYIFRKPTFSPYGIHISFKWERILQDSGQIDGVEEWAKSWERAQSSPTHVHNVLRDGIRFNVLGPDLIYWKDRQSFMSRANLTVNDHEIGWIRVWQDWECYLITVELRRNPTSANKEICRGVFWIGLADKISLNQICLLEKTPLPADEQIEEWDGSSHRALVRQDGWNKEPKLSSSVEQLDRKYFSVELYSL